MVIILKMGKGAAAMEIALRSMGEHLNLKYSATTRAAIGVGALHF